MPSRTDIIAALLKSEEKDTPADSQPTGAASTPRPERRTANHWEIARGLKGRPYEWGTVAVYPAYATAAQIARKIRAARDTYTVYGPAGSFETRATPVGDGTLLEARYVLGIARPLNGLIQGSADTERVLGQIERREMRCGRDAAREIAARHEEAYGDVWQRPAPFPAGPDEVWADALTVLSPPTGPNGTPMTAPAPALPHDPYILAVVEALTAAGLEPDTYWTSDAETNPYDDGPDAGCTTMLTAVIGWDDNTDDNTGGLFLFWDHPAEQWQHARPRVSKGGNTDPEFLPKLGRWSDPAAVVATARALLAGEPMPEGHAPYWHPAAAVRRAVDAWDAQE